MSEYVRGEGAVEPIPGDLEATEAEDPKEEVKFRVVKLEPEDPDSVRKRSGLHAGGMIMGGIKRRGSKAPKKDWT
jgi:hypothetical protein